MKKAMSFMFVVGLNLCCFASKEVKKSVVVQPTREMPLQVQSVLLGEPVYNAELASTLGELVLAQHGVDCRNSLQRVSFCDGIYQVVFDLSTESAKKIYTVEIDSRNARILRVIIS